jgi:hypothetical protein
VTLFVTLVRYDELADILFTMTIVTLLPGSYLATGIYNLDSARNSAAPRDTRKAGWTEAWGADQDEVEEPSRYALDTEAIASLLATPYPQIPLVLTQFRPAWMEQMTLRMAKIPFIVVNSNHATHESTGSLPYLRDHKVASEPPVLVGRHHPSNIASPNPLAQNHILEYLKCARKIDLNSALETSEQKSLSKCYLTVIQAELDPLLLYLRYEDYDAWEQVYRRQYLNASSPHSQSWITHLHGRFQASLERITMRRRLIETTRVMTISRAVARAKEAYSALDLQLQRHGGAYLLATRTPAVVDAVLWSHLAEALCDVHLVVVLAEFSHLVKYFQDLHNTYFERADSPWEEWNRAQNKKNAFEQLPFNDTKKLSATGFKDAIDLMQSLSLQNRNLQEVLDTTKAKIASEPWPTQMASTESLFYRWRMGEDLNKSDESEQHDQQNEMRKKILRDQARNDQLWISSVVGVSAVAIFLLQGTPEKSS